MKDERIFLEQLVESTQALALDYDTQINLFPEYVNVPDELALTFFDSFLLMDQVLQAGLIDDIQMKKINKIDCLLKELSNSKESWSLEALKKAPAWSNIRKEAFELLTMLGRDIVRPKLKWIRFIRDEEIE